MTHVSLVGICWALWGILLAGLVVVAVKAYRQPSVGIVAARGLASWMIATLFVLMGVAAGLLYWLGQTEPGVGLTILAVVLGYPVLALAASGVVVLWRSWRHRQILSRVGDFRQPRLREMAEAIREDAPQRLRELLGAEPPPEGKDLAGHDLLTYALIAVRDEGRTVEHVRVLLEAGAEPRRACLPDGLHVLHYLVTARIAGAQEAARLILRYGADPNDVSIRSGDTPLRHAGGDATTVQALVEHGAEVDRLQANGLPALAEYVAARQWRAAVCLIEQGAALDFRDEGGQSLDTLLEDWRREDGASDPDGRNQLVKVVEARRKAGR